MGKSRGEAQKEPLFFRAAENVSAPDIPRREKISPLTPPPKKSF